MELECSIPTAVFDPGGVFSTATLSRPTDSDLADFVVKNPELKTLSIEGKQRHHLEAIAMRLIRGLTLVVTHCRITDNKK